MALQGLVEQVKTFFTIAVLLAYLSCKVVCETGDCRQQEFRDRSGNCILCPQCGPGMELSKECGFGYGEDAQCVTCRPHRFKEDWGFQKCKPCLDCALGNRFQKANCSQTSDAVCGDCLPGFYRKTKLVGFQDMECVPCGDPPPPYEPHCTIKVNLVKIPSTASSPRDTALAAVICSALATVLLALLILCVIYCKRQFMEKKPSWSLRAQDIGYSGSELSCFDRPRCNAYGPRTCCQCHWDSAQTCGPVHLVPSLCREEACGLDPVAPGCAARPQAVLQDRPTGSPGCPLPSVRGEFSDAWPLMQSPACGDSLSLCDSYPELIGEHIRDFNPENENPPSLDSDGHQDLAGGAAHTQTRSENSAEATDLSQHNKTLGDPAPTRATLTASCQQGLEGDNAVGLTARTPRQMGHGRENESTLFINSSLNGSAHMSISSAGRSLKDCLLSTIEVFVWSPESIPLGLIDRAWSEPCLASGDKSRTKSAAFFSLSTSGI